MGQALYRKKRKQEPLLLYEDCEGVVEDMSNETVLRKRWDIQRHTLMKSLKKGGKKEQLKPRRVAGCDVSYSKEHPNLAFAAVVVYDLGDDPSDQRQHRIVYKATHTVRVFAPYIPGYLAFREVPILKPMIDAIPKAFRPDVLMVDGNGILHPFRFGSACHLGVVCKIPSIGVAKSLHVLNSDFPKHKDIQHNMVVNNILEEDVFDHQELLGKAIRTDLNVKNPIYVSVGHAITLENAVFVTRCCSIYRVPEPIRHADRISREKLAAHIDDYD